MFRLFDHIFKKYRIVSYYNNTAYVAIIYDYGWHGIGRGVLNNKCTTITRDWYFGNKLVFPCYSWIEVFCMVDSIEKAELMIKIHKEHNHKK
jgi:hypothetical protein